MIAPLVVTSDPAIAAAIAGFGRTEDVAWSPDGTRLVVAGFGRNVLVVLEVSTHDDQEGITSVHIAGVTTVSSSLLAAPHGVCFLGHDAIAVANRNADVLVLVLPAPAAGVIDAVIEPTQVFVADASTGLQTPGSVAAVRVAADLYELIVCNNYVHTVTSHWLDGRDGFRMIHNRAVVRARLDVPDGVAISRDGAWMAISNHNTHTVLVYRRSRLTDPDVQPDAELVAVNYPHGLHFTADGAHLVVADAGMPYLNVYARSGADWEGRIEPRAVLRVMDDPTFLATRYNIEEGGTKGVDVHPSLPIVAATSEAQPVQFFATADVFPSAVSDAAVTQTDGVGLGSADESARVALLHLLQVKEASASEAVARRAELDSTAARLAAVEGELDASRAQLATVGDQLADREGELSDAHARADRQASDLVWLMGDRDATVHRAVHAEATVAARDNEIAALRRSRSWRLSAPLRAPGRLRSLVTRRR